MSPGISPILSSLGKDLKKSVTRGPIHLLLSSPRRHFWGLSRTSWSPRTPGTAAQGEVSSSLSGHTKHAVSCVRSRSAKKIAFTSSDQLPPGEGDVPRDIGSGEVNGVDITNEMLSHGWAKVKDLKREATDDDLRRRSKIG
jgi:hypothetical protein